MSDCWNPLAGLRTGQADRKMALLVSDRDARAAIRIRDDPATRGIVDSNLVKECLIRVADAKRGTQAIAGCRNAGGFDPPIRFHLVRRVGRYPPSLNAGQ